ncbi:uncharacterized protein LOC100495124 [Xenopus tropicalis]|uniref:Uncharacterized protein LOC100495124 n=1 Tax=Xenopus tropicalis TaxID=8364 RepID=A0A1B8XV34_XENTR|nr:uncharacterized protein LOC100495124 [Xenopus tropicalis]|eukprot:XP_002935625.2 PREDICTED: uncharacterized protein LOC100495124 [Xenopus tropicalis]
MDDLYCSEDKQSLKTLLLVANDIGKLKPEVHITFHAVTVLQRCKLFGITNPTDQVKVLLLTIEMSTWQCLSDSIKEGKGNYDETVDELLKILHPFDIGFMAAYKTKQRQNENPLVFANRLWATYHIGKGRTGNRDDSEYKNLLICNAHPKIKAKCGFLIDPQTHAYDEIIVLMQRCFNVLQKRKPLRSRNGGINKLGATGNSFHVNPCISVINKESSHYNDNIQSKVTNINSAQRHAPNRNMQTESQCYTYQTLAFKVHTLDNALKTEHRKHVLREIELQTKINSLRNGISSLQAQNIALQQTTSALQLSHIDAIGKYNTCHAEMVKCKKKLNDLQERYLHLSNVPLKVIKSTQTEHTGENCKIAIVSGYSDVFKKQKHSKYGTQNHDTERHTSDVLDESDTYDLSSLFCQDHNAQLTEVKDNGCVLGTLENMESMNHYGNFPTISDCENWCTFNSGTVNPLGA